MIRVERIINSLYQSNSYIIHCEEYDWAWLIDAGDADRIQKWLSCHSLSLKGVLLTHTHYDHIYGLNDVNLLFPGITIYTSPEGRESLYNEKWNFSLYHHISFKYMGCNVFDLHDGDRIELWPNIIMSAFKTPGHDWSCLSYIIDGMLFTGDSYIPGIRTVTVFPKSNKREAEDSLIKIRSIPNIKMVYPGHGKSFPIGETDLFKQ